MFNKTQYQNDINSTVDVPQGRILLRNIIFNIIGHASPLVVAIFSIPILIKSLGVDRYGVLNLAWIIIGYFSIFDFGISRALTKLVAEKLAIGNKDEIDELIWTSLFLKIILGIAGATLVLISSPWIVYHALKVPILLQPETLNTLYLLSISIPIVISTAGLRGILEAYQCFGYINIVRILLGIFNYVGPLLVLPFTSNLLSVVAVLFLARLIAWVVHIFLCLKIVPTLRKNIIFNGSLIKYLLNYGGWITISNIISPLMDYLDRFLIATLISVTAVTYYVTPYDVLTKLLLIPTAITGVLFPTFSSVFVRNQNDTLRILKQGVKFIFIIIFPVILTIIVFGREGLQIWLGQEFAQRSTFILKWLSIGVLVNSLSRVFFTLLQGIGRPDITAKLHMIELPFYIFAAWLLITNFNIKGAAIVWVMRISLDGLLLYLMTKNVFPQVNILSKEIRVLVIIASILILSTLIISNLIFKICFIILIIPSFLLFSWLYVLLPPERAALLSYVKTPNLLNRNRISHG